MVNIGIMHLKAVGMDQPSQPNFFSYGKVGEYPVIFIHLLEAATVAWERMDFASIVADCVASWCPVSYS